VNTGTAQSYGGGRYVATNSVHTGGLSSVVACRDLNLDRLVAIKFLQPGIDKVRIYDEIVALQQVRSKHVVQVYDVIVVVPGNHLGIVQEFLAGPDLSGGIADPTDQDDVLRTLFQLASGVADIHAHGIIHRDIKPNNAKRDSEELVKLFDFGLARPAPNAATSGFRGTPGFAAPELFGTGYVSFTSAIDAYALAATALYCLTGSLPPELMTNPPNPEAWKQRGGFGLFAAVLPGSVASVLNASLSTRPGARPEASDLRDTIAAHLLHGKHRASLMYPGRHHICDSTQTTARVAVTNLGSLDILYDGSRFLVRAVSGDVSINNRRISQGDVLSGSCLITLGAANLGSSRVYVTFDESHPEVVL